MQSHNDDEWAEQFIEKVYEIAFGEGAIKKGYCPREVLDKLREFSDGALENDNS